MFAAEAFLADINRFAPARGNVVVGDLPDDGRPRAKKRQRHEDTTHHGLNIRVQLRRCKICIQTHPKIEAGSKPFSTKRGLSLQEILWHMLGNASTVTT